MGTTRTVGGGVCVCPGGHCSSEESSSPPLRYKNIVKYKTSFYTAYLPVAAAMYMVREPRLPSLPTDVAFWTGGDRTIWCLH